MTDTLTAMRVATARHPDLTPLGFKSDGFNSPAVMLTPATLEQFERATAWLASAPRSRRPIVSSYWAKHIVERLTGHVISNGALIAAASHLGIKLERADAVAYYDVLRRRVRNARILRGIAIASLLCLIYAWRHGLAITLTRG